MELSLKKKKLPRKKTKLLPKVKLLFQFKKYLFFVFSFMISKEVSTKKKMLFTGVVAVYVFSPIDFFPEILLGPFGFVDDASAIAFFLNWMFKSAPSSLKEKYKLN